MQKPANSLELIKWLIFEPVLLRIYSVSLNRKQAAKDFLKAYAWMVGFTICLWSLANLVIALLDLPALFPHQFDSKIIEGWSSQTTWWAKFIFYSKYTSLGLAVGLAGGLAVGLAGGLVGGLAVGLAVGLSGGLAGGLAVGLAVGLAGGLAVGLAVGLAFGLALGLAFGLAVGLAFGFAGWLDVGLAGGLAFTGGFIISFYLFFFRIFPFYIFHWVKSWAAHDLNQNPYRRDGMIWLPVWGLDKILLDQAGQRPNEALEFVDFLVEYRPLQENLAMKLTHAAAAGLWRQQEFSAEALKKVPLISANKPEFQPSPDWLQTLAAAREELVAAELQTNAGFKVEYYRRYLTRVDALAELTRKKESSRWNYLYFPALEKWQAQTREEYQRLQLTAQTLEPITPNIYRAGDALTPKFDKEIFMGREDVRDELQNKILSSRRMPLFLIHGQRRVGKTSLLKFLPGILGPRFKVVYMDVQPIAGIYQWLDSLKAQFDLDFGLEPAPLPLPYPEADEKNWLTAWLALQDHLQKTAQSQECKIILAFDEYEKIHRHLQKKPETAEELLDAMRSFSQHQDKIVFLFVGAALFTELKNPDWSNYFVQAIPLPVDYLKREDTLKLIGVAPLEYPAEVPEEIYRLTRGHPTLVQRICHEMVNIANSQHRKKMTAADLDQVLASHIYRPQNGVVEVFWGQFCAAAPMKTTVRQILDGKLSTDRKSLFQLEEHGFILKEGDVYQIRVPIFREWLLRFGDVLG